MKKVCVVTSTRAEYGLLKPIMEKINKHQGLQLQLLVTGTHLEEKYGYTVNEIKQDGFNIDAEVKIICGESKHEIIKTMARSLDKFGKVLTELKPDIIVIDGDRYEMPPIALAATILNIPIAHIGGGDVTEGSYDDVFRHTLTKLSTLHFPITETYRTRIIQMGEQPERVYNVGSVGVENILNIKLLSKDELEKQINFKVDEDTLLVTFHPITNEINSQGEQIRALIDALEEKNNFRVVFTRPNADTNRDEINVMIDKFIKQHSHRSVAFESMGLLRYLSAMKYCLAVVGNSSSGIIEAPSMRVASINIGNRQKGRIKADSVIDCSPEKEQIIAALDYISTQDFKEILKSVKNPYQGISTSTNITEELYKYLLKDNKGGKEFYNINFSR